MNDIGNPDALMQFIRIYLTPRCQLRHTHRSVMSTAPKSTLDVLLEEFQSLIDLWLPLLGPLFGLSELDAIKITRQVDKFVADTEAVEHGQVDVTDGLAAMITDILEILKLLGIDWIAPSK